MVSFDGGEQGDIFVHIQEVDTILSRFSNSDLSEQTKCRIFIAGMKCPARKSTATNVQVGNMSDKVYVTVSDAIFELYMKLATAVETNIRIWNLSQKSNENATARGARCMRAMMYRFKKNIDIRSSGKTKK